MVNRTFGIDISYHQATTNYKQAVSAGVRFAFVRCCKNMKFDPYFKTHWNGCKEAGIMRGAYCLGDYNQYASAQAEYFAKVLLADKGELPPVLDIEQLEGYPFPSRLAFLSWIETFLVVIYEAIGKRAILYTNPALIKHLSPIPTDLLAHDLWLAHYLYPASVAAGWQPTFKPWNRYTFWQYSSHGDGTKYGTTSLNVDCNYFNGDYNSLLAYSKIYTTGGGQPQPDKSIDDRVTALEVAARAHGWEI